MKIIKNNYIPFKGFFALNFFGIIFVRRDKWSYYSKNYPHFIMDMRTHESIHTAQMKDFCSWILIGGSIFYLIYSIEWIYRLFQYNLDTNLAYHAVSFEKEAYKNEMDEQYLIVREKFAQWKNS